jgi:hypothetical protein
LAESRPDGVLVDFGVPEARAFLDYGWSGDEQWMDGKLSVVWAQGFASALRLPFTHQGNYRFFLHLYPFMPKGPACQRIDTRVNGIPAARLHLEQGWHWYELKVPEKAVREGINNVQFSFDRAESPRSLGLSADERPLSVAFGSLVAVPDER